MEKFKFIAALEISTDEIRFAVSRISFVTDTFIVVQKNRLLGNWIEREHINDREKIISFLQEAIDKFETNFQTKLDKISLVIPDFAARSVRVEERMLVEQPRVLTQKDYSVLVNKVGRRIESDFERTIRVQGTEARVNGHLVRREHFQALGQELTGIFFVTLAKREIINDHASIIDACDKKVGFIRTTSMAYSEILLEDKTPINVIVNWTNKKIVTSYYTNGILREVKEWQNGLENIVTALATKLPNMKNEFVRKYVFKMFDLSKTGPLDGETILRRGEGMFKTEVSSMEMKQMIYQKLTMMIKETDRIILSVVGNAPNIKVHHVGKISRFANYDKILKMNSQFKQNLEVTKLNVFGANENWTQALVGILGYEAQHKMLKMHRLINQQAVANNVYTTSEQLAKPLNPNFVHQTGYGQRDRFSPNYNGMIKNPNAQMIQKTYYK